MSPARVGGRVCVSTHLFWKGTVNPGHSLETPFPTSSVSQGLFGDRMLGCLLGLHLCEHICIPHTQDSLS
jgi:hypothetical protein